MPRYIDADAQKEWVENWLYKDRYYHSGRVGKTIPITELYDLLEQIPTADVVERKVGKWKERKTFYAGAKNPIEEWQSARCSICGKYHTTPYLYYFDDYNYCPNCGAEMKGEDDAEVH